MSEVIPHGKSRFSLHSFNLLGEVGFLNQQLDIAFFPLFHFISYALQPVFLSFTLRVSHCLSTVFVEGGQSVHKTSTSLNQKQLFLDFTLLTSTSSMKFIQLKMQNSTLELRSVKHTTDAQAPLISSCMQNTQVRRSEGT